MMTNIHRWFTHRRSFDMRETFSERPFKYFSRRVRVTALKRAGRCCWDMPSLKLSAPFFLGTACGVVAAFILFSSHRIRLPGLSVSSVFVGGERETRGNGATSWSAPSSVKTVSRNGGEVGVNVALKDDARSSSSGQRRRKVFLDCGANVASSVDLFLDTYPHGEWFELKTSQASGRNSTRRFLSMVLFFLFAISAEEYEIFSFEIDPTLRPYFADRSSRHRLFCPTAVGAVRNNVTAYLQGPWSPKDGLQDGKDMHWGKWTWMKLICDFW